MRVADAQGMPPTTPFWLGEAPARTVELSAQVSALRALVERHLAGERRRRRACGGARGRRRRRRRRGDGRRVPRGRPPRPRRAADDGPARRRAVLRRQRGRPARRALAARRADQPRARARAAQALLRDVRLRAAGRGERRRRHDRARAAPLLPAQRRREDGAGGQGARDPHPGGAPAADARGAVALERRARARHAEGDDRGASPDPPAAHGGRRPHGRDLAVARGVPGERARPARSRCPTTPSSARPSTTCSSSRSTSSGSRRCSRAIADGRGRGRARGVPGAVGARPRDPERRAVHLPRRRAARGAPQPCGRARAAGSARSGRTACPTGPVAADPLDDAIVAEVVASAAPRVRSRRRAARAARRPRRASDRSRVAALRRRARAIAGRLERRATARGSPPSAARRPTRLDVDDDVAAGLRPRPPPARRARHGRGRSSATASSARGRCAARRSACRARARRWPRSRRRATRSRCPTAGGARGTCSCAATASRDSAAGAASSRSGSPTTSTSSASGSASSRRRSFEGRAGVLAAIEQLQGIELPAGDWEAHVLPARVAHYDPTWLDELCLVGRGRLGAAHPAPRRRRGAARLGDAVGRDAARPRVPRRPRLAAARRAARRGRPPRPPHGASRDLLDALERHGAQFRAELADARRRGCPSRSTRGCGTSSRAGIATADAFSAVRSLLDARARFRARQRRLPVARLARAPRRALAGTGVGEGRWSVVASPPGEPDGRRARGARRARRDPAARALGRRRLRAHEPRERAGAVAPRRLGAATPRGARRGRRRAVRRGRRPASSTRPRTPPSCSPRAARAAWAARSRSRARTRSTSPAPCCPARACRRSATARCTVAAGDVTDAAS